MKIVIARQLGFGILGAIFVLVILAGLTAAIANLSATQRAGVSQDVQGVRAYHAARAGIEWGVYQSLNSGTNPPCPTGSFIPPATTLQSFTVTVTCVDSSDNSTIVMRRLTAVACNEPEAGTGCPKSTVSRSDDYVERRVQVTIRRP